jgi:hypothetical protein
MRNDFAVLILSHGRPNNIKTIKALENANYTGKYYIVIDNEDKAKDEYIKLYGDKVIVFDKQAISDNPKYDKFDNNNNKKVIFFARNASMEIAKDLGLKYYIQFDDDYTNFTFKYQDGESLRGVKNKKLDKTFDLMIDLLDKTKALSICMGQGGDYVGGIKSSLWIHQFKRKGMNSFLVNTDKLFKFYGRINEDVNTYTMLGNKGELFFTVADISLNQTQTQSNSGGMTDVYLDNGTYVKTFYSVICSPQAVKVGLVGPSHLRMHHKINWNYCTPKILNERYKKF